MKEKRVCVEILYVSSVCSTEVYKELQKEFIKPTQYSIQKFHNLIIKGIATDLHGKIEVLSGIPVSKANIKKTVFHKKITQTENIKYTHLGFLNIRGLKQIIISIEMAINLLRWNRKNRKNPNKIIICDAAYVSVMPIIVFLSKILRIQKVAIVADIYEYMSDKLKQRKKTGGIKKIITKLCNYCWKNYDGYILLTEQMNNIVNPNNKPYIIMEGIAECQHEEKSDKKKKEKYIMYAGGLWEKYGIKNLVDGFNLLTDINIELHLYGQGDMVDYIKEISKENPKIKYMGVKGNSEVVKAEEEAVLLINPRPSNEEYTLYSFPSKTMEYMLTGTPVLMTKLPGMPKEYYEYVYFIEDETSEGIKKSISKILTEISENELIEKGIRAQKFIEENKNYIVQGNRIKQLIKLVLNKRKKSK